MNSNKKKSTPAPDSINSIEHSVEEVYFVRDEKGIIKGSGPSPLDGQTSSFICNEFISKQYEGDKFRAKVASCFASRERDGRVSSFDVVELVYCPLNFVFEANGTSISCFLNDKPVKGTLKKSLQIECLTRGSIDQKLVSIRKRLKSLTRTNEEYQNSLLSLDDAYALAEGAFSSHKMWRK